MHSTRYSRKPWWQKAAALAAGITLYAQAFAQNPAAPTADTAAYSPKGNRLVGRAVLPAATFAPGPTSGQYIGGAVNKQAVPFVDKQPVQGFSSVLDNKDGTFLALSDNGFGSIENSADYHLRVYTIRPRFERKNGGKGDVRVRDFIELHDPDKKIPFAIVNHFTDQRILTGADFDVESFQRADDGTFWFGDEFGPFLLHTDPLGKVLEAPIPLPDFDNPGQEIRAPQNPFSEESSALRVMNAVRTHAQRNGNAKAPVFSPWYPLLNDNNPATGAPDRLTPPDSSGLARASSDIFNVRSLRNAGYPVVAWTVNDTASMRALLRLGVNGIISDRPDLLREVAYGYDGNADGQPDFVGPDGLLDIAKFDAQGHRGGRNLRPENTLPAMEAALDNLLTTLETDCGISKDGVPVLDHDPHIEAAKTRRADGQPYLYEEEVFVKDLTVAEIQSTFIADKLLDGRPLQTNDRSLSPVSVAFAGQYGLPDVYVMPTLAQLFDFVDFYVAYYRTGAGKDAPDAEKRWKNARRVCFNVETKINPRTDTDPKGDVFAGRTVDAETFAKAVAGVIVAKGLQDRADIQSFDFRTLLVVQAQYPQIRTAYLFGDFPKLGNGGDDGTNLQPQGEANTPWLAGLYWPYRSTAVSNPFRARGSGGFEGMAYDRWSNRLLPLLEQPLVGDDPKTLLIHAFDLGQKQYTGVRYRYGLDARGTAIGEFNLFSPRRGVVIEREGSQGNLQGFKAIYEIQLGDPETAVGKRLAVDLLNIQDPDEISLPGLPGDVGLGQRFAFPFTTIESVVVFDEKHLGVVNDNNYPFSVGRHVGDTLPDDNEFIRIRLQQPLGTAFIEGNGGFTLIDAEGDQDLRALVNNAVIDLAALPSRKLNVRVDFPDPSSVKSVVFGLNGQPAFQVENIPPYALGGNTGDDYDPVTLPVGTHTLTATPYSLRGGRGVAGKPVTVTFEVKDSEADSAGVAAAGSVTEASVSAFPNPFTGKVSLAFRRFGGTAVRVRVYDSYGTVVHTSRHALRTGNGTFDVDLDRLALRKGLYLVTVESSAGETKTIRLYKK